MSVAGTVGALTDLAASSAALDVFRAEAIAMLDRAVGFDFAVLWRVDGPAPSAPTVVGFPMRYWELFASQHATFEHELGPLMSRCIVQGAVGDRDVFSVTDRSRMAFYAEIVRPVGSRSYLTGALSAGGRLVAMLQLGRGTGAMSERDAARLRPLLGAMALGEAVRDARAGAGAVDACLSRREREIVDLVVRGFTNAEIAALCGTSANTVRNQLARVFRKLQVTTRAELAGLAAKSGVA